MFAQPKPNKTYPASDACQVGASVRVANPKVAKDVPKVIARPRPSRSTTVSPINLVTVIVNAKLPYPRAAVLGLRDRMSVRNTALQSNTAPSAKKTTNAIAPNSNRDPFGSAIDGPDSFIASLCQWRAAAKSMTSMRVAATNAATHASFYIQSNVITTIAPSMPPTLKKAWKLDIIARPDSCSTATPCMFIAQFIRPKLAPKRNSDAASDAKLGAAASRPKLMQISTVQ